MLLSSHFVFSEVKKERKLTKKPHKGLDRSNSLSRKVCYEVRGGCSFHVGSGPVDDDVDHGISLITAKSW